jgi:hypothetical protein
MRPVMGQPGDLHGFGGGHELVSNKPDEAGQRGTPAVAGAGRR